MSVKVIVPNKYYSEHVFGVQFKNGEAVFEDEKRGKAIANRLGYKVEPVKKPAKPKAKAPAKKEADKAEDKKEV